MKLPFSKNNNKNTIRISVIITSFNDPNRLEKAINSVLRQSYQPHEIILSDDASTDRSIELIREYRDRHPNLIKAIFQQKNVGIPRNRNSALSIVTGNYVGILDGDDFFREDKLELQAKALEEQPNAKGVYSNFIRIDDDGSPIKPRYDKPQPQGNIFHEVCKLNFGLLRTMIVDYDIAKLVGFMDARFPRYDGFWFSLQVSRICEFAYIHQPLVFKTEHKNSDSRTMSELEMRSELSNIYNSLKPFLTDIEKDEREEIDNCWKSILSTG